MLFATFCGLPLICYVSLSFYCMILHNIIHILIIHILSVHYKFLQLCKLSRIFSFFVIFNMLILYIPFEEGGLNLVHYNVESFKIFPSVFLKNAYLTFWRRYLYSTMLQYFLLPIHYLWSKFFSLFSDLSFEIMTALT